MTAADLARQFRFTFTSHLLPACGLVAIAAIELPAAWKAVVGVGASTTFTQIVAGALGFASVMLIGTILDGASLFFMCVWCDRLWARYEVVNKSGDKYAIERLTRMNAMLSCCRTFTVGTVALWFWLWSRDHTPVLGAPTFALITIGSALSSLVVGHVLGDMARRLAERSAAPSPLPVADLSTAVVAAGPCPAEACANPPERDALGCTQVSQ
jgi:hypothetical protein